MSTQGVIIDKGKVGPNALSGSDGESGLILHGVAVADKIALGEIKVLYSLKDALALGLDAAYDTTNNIRVYHHIKEFYRIPTALGVTGLPLHIMLVDNSVTTGDLDITLEDIITDTTSIYAKKLITDAGGKIRLLGAGMNPAAGYTSTILDGLDADVRATIPKAQLLADWAWDTHRPIHVFLEGREFSGTAAAAQDLRAITGVEAGQVSVTILQDYGYAEGLDALGKKYADIGTLLGAAAAIAVHQNVGEVETMNLQDVTRDAFVTPGISSHQTLNEVEDEFDTFDTKGYVMGITYSDYAGVYVNDDHACAPVVIDAEGFENINSISASRVIGKARRRLRNALLPKVKSTHEVDATTGKLPVEKIKYFEGIGDEEFLTMQKAGEISGGKTYVDPDSDLRTPPKSLLVDYAVVTNVSIGEIRGSINLKTSI